MCFVKVTPLLCIWFSGWVFVCSVDVLSVIFGWSLVGWKMDQESSIGNSRSGDFRGLSWGVSTAQALVVGIVSSLCLSPLEFYHLLCSNLALMSTFFIVLSQWFLIALFCPLFSLCCCWYGVNSLWVGSAVNWVHTMIIWMVLYIVFEGIPVIILAWNKFISSL